MQIDLTRIEKLITRMVDAASSKAPVRNGYRSARSELSSQIMAIIENNDRLRERIAVLERHNAVLKMALGRKADLGE